MELRPIGDKDVDPVVALWRRCGLTRPWNDPLTDLANARRTSTAEVMIGCEQGRLVGTVMVGFDGHRGWVYYLAVEPEFQGQGLGGQLMRAAEAWLAERGAPKLNLMVREDNAAAVGFYERLGYERQPVATLGRRLTAGAQAPSVTALARRATSPVNGGG